MISIIVTHKKDTFYLKDCLSSIAEQKYTDYETILVVDHSEDDLTELIDTFGGKINLKVYETTDKSGCAAARNLGLEKATGDYIFILDNDDYILPDTLELLMETMDENTDVTYAKIMHTWFQRQAFNVSQQDTEVDEFQLQFDFNNPLEYRYERYRKLDKLTVLGMLIRKSLLIDNDIKFDDNLTFFSDPEVVTKIFQKARCIKGKEEAVYVNRHHNDKVNNPALCQHVKEETMDDYFKVFAATKEAAKGNEKLERHVALLIGKFIVKEYIKKIRWSDDPRWKKEYFKELQKATKDIKKKYFRNKEFGPIERGMIFATIKGDYAKMQKKSLRILFYRKLKKMLFDKVAFKKAITLHLFNKMKTKENWIVFESFMGRNCSGQPKYIYKYLQQNYGNKYKYIWIVDRKGVKIDGKHKKVKRMSLKYYYYMNRSKYWVNNMRQPLSIPRRLETIMLSTWHGTPLKRLVFDMDDVHSANPKYKEIVYKQTRGWDYLLSDNPFSTEKFQSCFLFEKEKILEYGYPANDPMYAPDREERAAKIKQQLGIPADKKVILYAPTWRDDNFYEAGQYGFDLDLDVDRLQKEFGDEYVLLLRFHYFIVDKLDLGKFGDFTIDGSSYDDITDLYLVSDILITDYSSVFFDFANLKRPILYYTYDLEKYRDVLRGFYLDMEKDLPGPLLLTNDDVVDAIKNIDKISEEYKDRYEEFYNEYCCVDDGNAAKRVVDKVFGA